jgi:hypothetical protein
MRDRVRSVIPRGARHCRVILTRGAGVAVRVRVPAAIPRRYSMRAVLQVGHIARCGRFVRCSDAGRYRTRSIERRRRIGREDILRRFRNVNVMRYD